MSHPKRLVLIFFLSLFSYPALAAGPEDAVKGFHAALAAGEKDKALEFLAEETAVYESGYVERSRAEYASHHLESDIAFLANMDREVMTFNLEVIGNLAVAFSESRTRGQFRDKSYDLLGTETMVLRKQDGAWKIIHIHWSSRPANRD